MCGGCRKHFHENPDIREITDEKKEVTEKMLSEKQCAVIYTDFWEAYAGVLPSERHRPVAENSGKTSYTERFNNTVRQRISRSVRKTLSFSEKPENHIMSNTAFYSLL